jgi:hypothetical protein
MTEQQKENPAGLPDSDRENQSRSKVVADQRQTDPVCTDQKWLRPAPAAARRKQGSVQNWPQKKICEGTKHRLQQKLTRRVCAGLSLCAGTAHSGAKQRTKQQDTHARSNVNQVATLEGTHAAKPRERCRARKKSEREEQNRHVERRNTKNFKSRAD